MNTIDIPPVDKETRRRIRAALLPRFRAGRLHWNVAPDLQEIETEVWGSYDRRGGSYDHFAKVSAVADQLIRELYPARTAHRAWQDLWKQLGETMLFRFFYALYWTVRAALHRSH